MCQKVIGSPFDEIVAAHLKYAFLEIYSALHACSCVCVLFELSAKPDCDLLLIPCLCRAVECINEGNCIGAYTAQSVVVQYPNSLLFFSTS